MVSLDFPPEIQQFVHQEIASGKYRSEAELVVEAVRRLRASKLAFEQLRAEVQEGVDALDRGDDIELEDDAALAAFFDEIEAEVRAERRNEK